MISRRLAISKTKKKKKGRGGRGRRGRGRGRGKGRGRQQTSKKKSRSKTPKRARSKTPKRSKKKQPNRARSKTPNRGNKGIKGIAITNLNYDVTENDVKEIFQKIGKVKKALIHYNAQGKSRGTAIVYYQNSAHCVKAVNEYHQAEVDGRPMYVKVLAVAGSVSRAKTPVVNVQKKRRSNSRGRRGRGRGRGKGKIRKRSQSKGKGQKKSKRGRGRGRGRGKGKKRTKTPSKTAEQLDKEMEDYHNAGTSSSGLDYVAAGQPDTAKLFSGDTEGEN